MISGELSDALKQEVDARKREANARKQTEQSLAEERQTSENLNATLREHDVDS